MSWISLRSGMGPYSPTIIILKESGAVELYFAIKHSKKPYTYVNQHGEEITELLDEPIAFLNIPTPDNIKISLEHLRLTESDLSKKHELIEQHIMALQKSVVRQDK